MTEINKDELLDLKKWQRFFFMVLYSFAINGVAGILIVLAAIQFIFYLFSSQINAKLQSANNWLLNFFNDAVNFISFNTNAKPWPFSDKDEASDAEEEVETVEVVEGESEEVESDDEQPSS